MKRLMILFVFLAVFQVQDTREMNNSDDLQVMMKVAEESELELEGWQDIYKEVISLHKFEEIKQLLSDTYTIQTNKTEKLQEYTFSPIKSTAAGQIDHRIKVMIPTVNGQKVKLYTEFHGVKWNESIRDHYIHLTKQLQNDYQLKLHRSFTCAKMTEDGIIEDGVLLSRIMSKLHAIHIDEQDDNVIDSTYERNVYGNSPFFDHAIHVEDELINFQAVIRKTTNQRKSVILGTPLILDEY